MAGYHVPTSVKKIQIFLLTFFKFLLYYYSNSESMRLSNFFIPTMKGIQVLYLHYCVVAFSSTSRICW